MSKYPWQDFQDQRREERRPKPKLPGVKIVGFINLSEMKLTTKPVKKTPSKPYPKLMGRCISHFNKFIRERDKENGCITCGDPVTEAGHYYSAGKFNALRFNEDNVHGQCTVCNCIKNGNLVLYRIELIKKIGIERVTFLDNVAMNLKPFKWEKEVLKRIYDKYRDKK